MERNLSFELEPTKFLILYLMKYLLLLTTLMFAGFCFGDEADLPSLEKYWTVTGLDAPESVVADTSKHFFYVSNVNGGGSDKDNNGYITTVSLSGEILKKRWLEGLNGPKGLAVSSGKLYVSDIDQLVIIDTVTATISDRINIEGAGFLNDVAIDNDGNVLVSDSANSRIYSINAQHEVSIWMQDERFGGVNGLHVRDDDILITTMSAGELLSVRQKDQSITGLAVGMTNADGIAELKSGYLISSWPGQLHYVKANGSSQILIDTSQQEQYMNDISRLDELLLVPNWQPGSLTAYRINMQ